jgi:predicted PurR-regulated permease PerM
MMARFIFPCSVVAAIAAAIFWQGYHDLGFAFGLVAGALFFGAAMIPDAA